MKGVIPLLKLGSCQGSYSDTFDCNHEKYVAFIYSLMNEAPKASDFIGKAMEMHQSQAEYLLSELDGDFRNVATSNAMKPMSEKAKLILGRK